MRSEIQLTHSDNFSVFYTLEMMTIAESAHIPILVCMMSTWFIVYLRFRVSICFSYPDKLYRTQTRVVQLLEQFVLLFETCRALIAHNEMSP